MARPFLGTDSHSHDDSNETLARPHRLNLFGDDARGKDLPLGGGYSDIERELREDLRDEGYDAVLNASNQDNRVALLGVRNDSVAARAGIREGSVVWSYDGQRVFRPRELAVLSTTGTRGEVVEIEIVTPQWNREVLRRERPPRRPTRIR